jgi:hypothetical protein
LIYWKTSVHNENRTEIHISSIWGRYSWLVTHYSVIHIFLRFWRTSSFGSIPKDKGVSLQFYKKCLFVTKTGRKSVLHLSEAHILARLDIRVLVLKNSKFWLKTKRISLWFYWQMSIHGKNWSKSVFHPGEAHILSWLDITKIYTFFWRFWKISSFGSKPKGVNVRFYRKHLFATKTGQNLHFIPTRSIFLLD